MNARRSVLRLACALLACALTCCVYLRQRQIQTLREGPFGRYTARQIVDRTLPLCRTILPNADGLLLSAERSQIYAPNGRIRLWWHVQGRDGAGRERAEFFWDAETGDLSFTAHAAGVSASRWSQPSSARTGTMTERQARAKAAWLTYRWLYRLGMAGEGSRWRLTQAPERSSARGTVWYARWQSADRKKAVIQVDVGSDTLISAQNWGVEAAPSTR